MHYKFHVHLCIREGLTTGGMETHKQCIIGGIFKTIIVATTEGKDGCMKRVKVCDISLCFYVLKKDFFFFLKWVMVKKTPTTAMIFPELLEETILIIFRLVC